MLHSSRPEDRLFVVFLSVSSQQMRSGASLCASLVVHFACAAGNAAGRRAGTLPDASRFPPAVLAFSLLSSAVSPLPLDDARPCGCMCLELVSLGLNFLFFFFFKYLVMFRVPTGVVVGR